MIKYFPFTPEGCFEDEYFVQIPDSAIPGINPYLGISNYGKVYDFSKNKFITGGYDKDGYNRISIKTIDNNGNPYYTKKGVHRLMLLGFDYNENHMQLVPNHLNGNTSDNRLDNLEWTDNKGNARHAIDTGLHKMYGEDNPNNKLTENQVREICNLIQTGKYYDTEIAAMYNITSTNIADMRKGKIWKNITKDYDLSNRKIRGITEEQAVRICELLQENKLTIKQIAEITNSNIPIVQSIRNKDCWTHISNNYDVNKPISKGFTENTIREICKVLQECKYTYDEIGAMFNTNKSFISNLKNKKTRWNYIVEEYNL